MANFLASKPYDEDSLQRYYMDIFPNSDETKLTPRAEQCRELINRQPGAEFARGTWWQAFNSVTYLTDHKQNTTAKKSMYNQYYGGKKLLKIRASKMAKEYAKAA